MAGPPRILVAEGNTLEARRRNAAMTGATASERYAATLRQLAPDATVDICFPSDSNPMLPATLDSYNGVAVTGSALNIYRREPESVRQIDFVRSVFAHGLPMFGSCWGLQLAAVAAGGDVAKNPRGREVGFARRVTLTEAGRVHPMHAGRAPVFDAPAIHADEVVTLPPATIVTASNAMSQVQAAEIRVGRSVIWGVQYHPEYQLEEVAAVVRRYGQILVDDGLFASAEDVEAYARDVSLLHADATRRDIASRMSIGRELLLEDERVREIANWITLKLRNAQEESRIS
jgi:GMP synthase (glutamine-hydrolysing)